VSADADDKTTLNQDTLERARGAAGPRASLVVYHGEAVKVMPLGEGPGLVVGRAWPSDVVVDDPSLSRQHARFTREREGIRVTDLGSTNGTHQHGERIETTMLGPGDAVTLGSVTVSVNLTASSAPLLDGIEPYERFFAHLSDELVRARTFRRPLALLMIKALGRDDAHVSGWAPRLRNTLRPVDRMALWGQGAVLALLVETDRVRARTVASALVDGDRDGEPTLLCGAALSGASAGALIDRARSLARQATRRSRVLLEDDKRARTVTDRPVFASPKMLALADLAKRVAASSIPVLVRGETGSGKEVIARAIHQASPRRDARMRSLNCGAIPHTLLESTLFGHEKGAFTGADRQTPGVFEQADGGTLFLDEVGELPAAAQAALLRVLETGRLTRVGGTEEVAVDTRVVTATHRDLDAMVEAGQFRQDLLFRLNTMTLEVPPLRERTEDLDALVERFLEEACREAGGGTRLLSDVARDALRAYEWPGNVRELRNVIERAVVVCAGDTIGLDDLPERVRAPSIPSAPPLPGGVPPTDAPEAADFKERVRAYETQLILDALQRTGGNQTQAAKLLRMPLRTLVHKIKSYGIKKSFDADSA